MGDQAGSGSDGTPSGETGSGDGGKEFQAITSQEALDRIIGDRVARVKGQFGDYDEVKAKAAKFDEVEEAAKSDLQKAEGKAEKLAQELEAFKAEQAQAKLKAEVAEAKGVPVGLLSGDSQEALEAHADQIIAYRGDDKSDDQPPGKVGPYVPGEGQGSDSKGSTLDDFAAWRERNIK